ncbi:pentapeptide repeat-containing protein [Streptomyces sp. NBC_00554]|uniref:pentapeptide repeat-containing protein n=1 Tax=Streptomyces sp. NBC_00554 TaxID=2903661 RepID=UPI00352F2CE5|nr:pentapeptide repeat-containing protein [Streptomyces sp. NBC_00554]
MLPFRRVVPLVLTVVVVLSVGLYFGVHALLSDAAASQKPRKPVNINDVIKTTATVLTLIGAALAGLYAYRKQLLAEGDAHRADANQLADRYTTAAGQLGHDTPAVRLAGVYALARLADDWPEQRQVCIDVLCAYLRMPYQPDPAEEGHKAGEREVRLAIISVIRDHLRDPDVPTCWCACVLDFTRATFDGGDFSESTFCGRMSFSGTTFSGGSVSFDDATFSGGSVSFDDATFSGDTVSFRRAKFHGGQVQVTFSGATFSGGTVRFNDAEFSGSVPFDHAEFSGSTVTFNDARIKGWASFVGAKFNGGTVIFSGTAISGSVPFDDAEFSSGRVSFRRTQFLGGTVRFDRARFSGSEVTFRSAEFSGGSVSFDTATFSGGSIPFDHATFRGTVFTWGPLPRPAGS